MSSAEKTPLDLPPLDIERAIKHGKDAFSGGNLEEAKTYFEAVLYDDPQNSTAIRWLRRIAGQQTAREKQSYITTRTRMLETVQEAWNTPKAKGKIIGCPTSSGKPTAEDLRQQELRRKLESIQIPSIAFQNADIQQVVLELAALCRELDDEGKGVNLVVFGTSKTLLPPVTFSSTDLSVQETLDVITQMSGMKYEIGSNMVILTPVNYEPPQQMVSAEFDVMPTVGAKMVLMTGGDAAPSGLLDVRSFFSSAPFPQGSSAQFNPEFNILLVHNASKYMPEIEALLKRYNQKALEERARQVEIETKFIEIAQGTLDELGFEWTVGENGSYLNEDTITIPGGQKLFTDTLRTGGEAFNANTGSALADSLTASAGELLVQKIKGDIPFDLLIRALERQQGSDLLSAPKILTKSGETATIHIGEIRSFPTAYDVIIERYAQPSLLPLDYEQYQTGVLLEVTPEVDVENGTIDLELAPEIRELTGFDEQHVGTIWPEYGDESLDMDASSEGSELLSFLTTREESRTENADRLIAYQPIFKTRKVETSVTIEDGSTIAMGGLIKEQMESFKDSVPILGKIPLLGRLFRSEGERSVKRNLLIFVTANQVNSSGYRKNLE
ncbi:type II secretion system protein GspD [Tichowtungia aerotolerans]|uniref:Type II/III secretion system secretin-like domain-containing protein n=1 Tax=Tichowtungia aerotolerans TaxID=2697043 RepID=A0A6P1MAZ3_9BACT|nr:hypothetical protein [Tichowtungia aerotolerans]QHI69268.1 hypothetical protein GT409_07320 [Tichowtungia aerotolerans]